MPETEQVKEFNLDRRKASLMERRGYGAFSVRVWRKNTCVHIKFSIYSNAMPSNFLSACEDIMTLKRWGRIFWQMVNYWYDSSGMHPQHWAEYIISTPDSEKLFEELDFSDGGD